MDYEAGSDPTTFMTHHELSRHGNFIYAPYPCPSIFIAGIPVPSCFTYCASHRYTYHIDRCVWLTCNPLLFVGARSWSGITSSHILPSLCTYHIHTYA